MSLETRIDYKRETDLLQSNLQHRSKVQIRMEHRNRVQDRDSALCPPAEEHAIDRHAGKFRGM